MSAAPVKPTDAVASRSRGVNTPEGHDDDDLRHSGQQPVANAPRWDLTHMILTELAQDHDERESFIVDSMVDAFSDLMASDPDAFRTRFRKMAGPPTSCGATGQDLIPVGIPRSHMSGAQPHIPPIPTG